MAAPDDSFFLDAISPEAYRHVTDDYETVGESRDKPPNDPPATSTGTEPSGASARDMSTPNTPLPKDASPQATFIFVIGDHRFSDSCELGILDEHPDALKAITSNPCLSASAFLKPALQAAMAELQPSLMVPAAVRLTAISLRLVARILPNYQSTHLDEGVGQGEEQKLSKMVQHELGQAVPHYRWQGSKHYCGRVQYLLALLEEAVRVMAVSKNALIEALKLDAAADDASRIVLQSIRGLEQDPEEVCGTWAAELLLSMCVSRQNRQRSTLLYPAPSTLTSKGLKPATPSGFEDEGEDEDELPSPSEFGRKRPDPKACRPVPLVEPRASKVNDDVVKSGNAEDPLCISDSDPEDHHPPGLRTESSDSAALRHSGRSQARKSVDYNVRRHPQDEYLPGVRKRPRVTQGENSTLESQTLAFKRNKA
ncbi:hypothetical protein LTR09_012664 [Extremus antarcticus]|uniref:Uncharacterized protein n=1 Tax=Extremus antarcticus TaxID=702011 RepID=A0AAJ0D4U4_9PEZI|nr:hypothetical protein LTR09_012664 [Extremus antarcticus]